MCDNAMEEEIEVWNIFHDGSIVEVKGDLPDISLRIEIPYLRNMFPGEGDSFWAHIKGCYHLKYLNWDDDKREASPNKIFEQEPEILSVKQIEGVAHITCVSGELDMAYETISFSIDTGVAVTIDELDKQCNSYWDD